MGGYQNLQSVKLSDFIDEDFLDDLVHDAANDDDQEKRRRSIKLPIDNLVN